MTTWADVIVAKHSRLHTLLTYWNYSICFIQSFYTIIGLKDDSVIDMFENNWMTAFFALAKFDYFNKIYLNGMVWSISSKTPLYNSLMFNCPATKNTSNKCVIHSCWRISFMFDNWFDIFKVFNFWQMFNISTTILHHSLSSTKANTEHSFFTDISKLSNRVTDYLT